MSRATGSLRGGSLAIPKRSLQGEWSGPLAFVFALAGVSIGLGNVWRFPALAAEHGGGAFLLVYGGFLATLTLPLWLAEIGIGRSMRRTLPDGLGRLAREQGSSRAWRGMGWLAVIAAAGLLVAQILLGGWVGAYLYQVSADAALSFDAVTTAAMFSDLLASPERWLLWCTLAIAAAALVVGRGIAGGIQPLMRVLVPGLLTALLGLAVWATENLGGGAAWGPVFEIRLHALGWNGVQAAAEHALFSVAVAVGVAAAFGAALPDRWPTVSTAGAALAVDTLFGLVAAVFVFSLLAPHGGDATVSGPVLAFHAMPESMAALPGGRQALQVFYLVLFVAALTTIVGLLEVVVGAVVEQGRVTRVQATVLVASTLWLGAVLLVATVPGWVEHGLTAAQPGGGLSVSWLLQLGAWTLIPAIALGLLLFVGWLVPGETLRGALRLREDWRYRSCLPVLRYVAPLILLVLLARVAGVSLT